MKPSRQLFDVHWCHETSVEAGVRQFPRRNELTAEWIQGLAVIFVRTFKSDNMNYRWIEISDQEELYIEPVV